MMDPIGLTLENFDATGRWRVNDGPTPIDPTGQLYDGQKLDGPASLRHALLKHTDAFRAGFCENLLSYALGRVLDYRDMPTARAIARDGARANDRLSAFLLAVVKSPAFQMRTLPSQTDNAARDNKGAF